MAIYDWDDSKSDRCLAERGFDFDYAIRLFEEGDRPAEFTDDRHDYGEHRVIEIGRIDGRLHAVVYTDRDDVRWIISAFRCRQRELERWWRRGAAGR